MFTLLGVSTAIQGEPSEASAAAGDSQLAGYNSHTRSLILKS